MKTVRNSAKLTGTLLVIAAATILIHYWYSVSDADYFDIVKAFMQTQEQIGGIHVFFMNAAFWLSATVATVNAALNSKSGVDFLFVAWIPLAIMCCLALLFIPDIGFTNIHLFWLICYILVIIGVWLSARQIGRFCKENSNFFEILKDSELKPELKVNRIDFIAAMLLMSLSYLLVGLAVIGALVFGIGNRELISGTDDVTPVVLSVRYDMAVRSMDDGNYEKAMIEFRNLEGYNDSASKASQCADLLYRPTYLEAIGQMNRGEYDEARYTFWSIYDYKDSAEKVIQCDELQYGPQYEEALALMDQGLYEDALAIFEALGNTNYEDTYDRIEQCRGFIKTTLTGTWWGDAGSEFTLNSDMTCHYVDGGGSPEGDGTWDAVDGRITITTDAFSYSLYGDLEDGYLTTSVLIKADSSSWRNETFTKE